MGKYIQYLRKSQMDRDYEELSVEETLKRHKKILLDFTTRKRINVTVVLEEVVTGESLSERPQMMKALELINTGEYDGIVCMDIDRLSRGSSFDTGYIMQILQVNNCVIITPDKTYDLRNESDEQFADMKFMFSRYELRTITKRLTNGRNSSASEGKYVGSAPPFGYDIVKLKGEKGNTLKINPDEAKIVQMIFDLYTEEKYGYSTLASHLNKLHIRTKTGREWSMNSIKAVLDNVVYTGKIRWKHYPQEKRIVDGKLVKKRIKKHEYEVHDGLHPAIISEDQYELACKMRSDRSIPSNKMGTEITNPFAGLMRCEKCGGRIKRNTHSQKYKGTHPRFKCYGVSSNGCDCKSTRCFEVEEIIITEMRKWLDGYMLTLDNKEIVQDNRLETALEILQKELNDLTAQQDNICDLLEKGVYTVQMFTKRNTILQEDIDRLTIDIEDLKEQIIEKQQTEVTQENIIPSAQKLLDNYEMLTAKEKNDLWKIVLEKITYYKGETGGEIHIKIYPKLQQKSAQTQ